MSKASDNPFPSLLVVEGSAPTSPAAGDQRVFIDSADHKFKRVNSSGTVVNIEAGGGSSTLAGDTDVSISSLVAGQHLAYDGSHWVNADPSKLQLDYTLATDVNALNVPASTWTDVIANQSFTVDDANSMIEVSVRGYALIIPNSNCDVSVRLIVDSAGTPITKMLGGTRTTSGNIFQGPDLVSLGALSAGSHTLKVQVYSTVAATNNLYCLPATSPNTYSLGMQVIERKR